MATKQAKAKRTDDAWEGVAPTDAEDSAMGGGLLPADWYRVVVDKAYFRDSKSSGIAYVNLELQVSEGDYEGRYLFCAMYVNSQSDNFRQGQKAFLAKFFDVCTGDVPDTFPETDDDLSSLVGSECSVKAIVEDNKDANGNTVEQNRVVRVRDADVEDTPAPAPARGAKKAASKRAAEPVEEEEGEEEEDDAPPTRNAARRPAAAPAAAAKGKTANKKGAGAFADMDDDIPF